MLGTAVIFTGLFTLAVSLSSLPSAPQSLLPTDFFRDYGPFRPSRIPVAATLEIMAARIQLLLTVFFSAIGLTSLRTQGGSLTLG
jgi:hypothetical protein